MENFDHKSLENDIVEFLTQKILTDYDFAQEAYAALCNTGWIKKDNKSGDPATFFSWRYAAGIISKIRKNFDSMNYMDFYCSGNEGVVSDLALEYFAEIGWEPISAERADKERDRIAADFRSAPNPATSGTPGIYGGSSS